MMQINWFSNTHKSNMIPDKILSNFNHNVIDKTCSFLSSIPQYNRTPLYHLNALAKEIGVESLDIKDESQRFGLNAFKGLGGAYAMASYFAQRLNIDLNNTTFEELMNQIKYLDKVTFATVTAGNHGKGIAWAAQIFNQKAKVILPSGSSPARLEAIQSLGAEAYISDLNYDDAVEYVAQQSEQSGWVLLQDTAWEGYTDLPLSIMKGYTTIVSEIIEQLDNQNLNQYTHVFLQAGVGSFAASMAACIYNLTKEQSPIFVITEPAKANCLYLSGESKTGETQRVYGDLNTMMAGLACGEPNPIAWEILRPITQYFLSCTDDVSAVGMRKLALPTGEDPAIISGESGALPLGVIYELMTNKTFEHVKQQLDLNKSSCILTINTEGNTNPKNYEKVINQNLN